MTTEVPEWRDTTEARAAEWLRRQILLVEWAERQRDNRDVTEDRDRLRRLIDEAVWIDTEEGE